MPTATLQLPIVLVGVKNAPPTSAQVNPATKENVEALPTAQAVADDDNAQLLRMIARATRGAGVVDASGRARLSVEVCPALTVTEATTIASGTITNNVGTVRLEMAGGWGLLNAYPQSIGLQVKHQNAYANAARTLIRN
jgi:hypothetical protein